MKATRVKFFLNSCLLTMEKVVHVFFILLLSLLLTSCTNSTKSGKENADTTSESREKTQVTFPSDVISSLNQWSILLGNGEGKNDLMNFQHEDYFYTENDGIHWVVFKAPNGGITSPNSHNTRTELSQKERWKPGTGGKLSGTLKVMHVSTSGDARVAASYAVVVGQIHSGDGHENEPLKIFYKKFPGHKKGSVFWNYEINTKGDNARRWDFSRAVWGYDMSVVGSGPDIYPAEPEDGVALGEEFSYEVNVYEGIMYLTFRCEGHETKTFTKSLVKSDYINDSDIPQQVLDLYSGLGRDGTEQANAYQDELQFFKQGAYNQTNGLDPGSNFVWSTGAETYDGDLKKQYTNGCYTEVWFRESSVGPSTKPID